MSRLAATLRRSVLWALLESIVTLAAALSTVLFVGRIIGPTAFGVAAVAYLVGSLAEVFVSCAFAEPLIQRPRLERRAVDAAFTAMIASAAVVYLGMLGIAPWLARLYGSPDLVTLIAVQGTTCLLLGLRAAPEAVMARKLRFRLLSVRSILAKVVGAVVALLAALAGAGAWSVVGGNVAFAVVSTVMVLAVTARRPRLVADPALTLHLLRFGIFSLLDALLWTATPRLFSFLVGSFHGVRALGQVNIAFRINDTACALIGAATARVALPLFSRVAEDRERLAMSFIAGTRLTFLVAAPVFLGLAFSSREIVAIALGPEWPSAAASLTAVSLYSVLNFSRLLAQPMLKAAGRPDLLVPQHLVGLAFITAACAMVSRDGLEAQLAVWVAFGVVYVACSTILLRRAIGIDWLSQFRPLGAALVPSLAMCLVLLEVARIGAGLPALPLLVLKVLLGAATYIGVLLALHRRLLLQLAGLDREAGRRSLDRVFS